MDITFANAIIAAVLFIGFAAYQIIAKPTVKKSSWILPAMVGCGFSVWTLATVLLEGPFGFWPLHSTSFWANQIWFDLLIAVAIGWFLIVPQARKVGMRLPFWLLFVVATGCIGFSAMLSRTLYLQART